MNEFEKYEYSLNYCHAYEWLYKDKRDIGKQQRTSQKTLIITMIPSFYKN